MDHEPPTTRPLLIEEWGQDHPRRAELSDLIRELGQSDWAAFHAPWHRTSHVLAVRWDGNVAGFLRFVVQEIGPEDDRPPVMFGGRALTEAKILAFGVARPYRGRGIGRALQEEALRLARQKGCYQVRSHSSGSNQANHHLKLSLGFAVHPVVRGDDTQGAYFILPLNPPAPQIP